MPEQNKHLVLVTTISAIGGVLLLFLLLCSCIRKYQKVKQEKEKHEDDRIDLLTRLPLHYSFQELQIATNNFSVKLGRGGFGSVYEGVLSDSSRMAVKILDKTGQGKKEFWAEVETLVKVDHFNLVRLKDFCAEKTHVMLVYEHLPNGSLDKWIFPNKMHHYMLEWKTRHKVVLNIARGLAYLHEDC
ncbi:hypothetical protein SUGI_1497370 [Cryptomeria japonica]|uniref:Protein kinase domain-containing protein n=2 Tax=Cryptomeria japonica TaxID=3369 RepID=A0AAD3NRG1_CRYJA|nr:hypothetical protein SUGI_1432390 [Cryptomeria japonica]GLJ59207.1 hypothetical protein SUGI_1497370 [Cryptomeria japonica]